jgi:hypothetical protein
MSNKPSIGLSIRLRLPIQAQATTGHLQALFATLMGSSPRDAAGCVQFLIPHNADPFWVTESELSHLLEVPP